MHLSDLGTFMFEHTACYATCFCEPLGTGLIVHPLMTWTNIFYLFAAVFVFAKRRVWGGPGFQVALLLLLIGAASTFYHLTIIHLSDWADFSSIIVLLLYLAYRRLQQTTAISVWVFASVVIAACTVMLLFESSHEPIAALAFLVFAGVEAHYRRHHSVTPIYLLSSVTLFVVGAVLWYLDLKRWLCIQAWYLQLHALWHLMTALGICLLYRNLSLRADGKAA